MDNGGLTAQAGFEYQKYVYIILISKIQKGESYKYECIDDILKTNKENFLLTKNDSVAIQVKKGKIGNDEKEKIILNWMIINQEYSIDKFVLVLKQRKIDFSTMDSSKIYNKISKSEKKNTSIYSKIKKLGYDEKKFMDVFVEITNANQIIIENIHDVLHQEYENIFNKIAIPEIVYEARVDELIKTIGLGISYKMLKMKEFEITHKNFYEIVENINSNISVEQYNPDYLNYTKNQEEKVNIEKLKTTREYKQLKGCEIGRQLISSYLLKKIYYFDYKKQMLIYEKQDNIEFIEQEAYHNFLMCKAVLIQNNKDIPINRLNETLDKKIPDEVNMYVRKGAYISLTAEKETAKQITWNEDIE